MSSISAVRAGKAFVEITANDTDFQRAMKRVQHSVVRLGSMMRQMGSGLLLAGVGMGLPMILAARSAATFEDALLELQGAATDVSDKGLKKVRDESLRLSSVMGVGPEKIAQAFALLVKAGVPLKNVMAEAGRAAVEFARVSGVEATVAAEFMSDAMNVFGVSATEAADTLSAAADSSSTSIPQLVEGFGQIASVGKITGQSLFGVSQALAVLAQYGLKGEEGATALKTMLTKLIAPSSGAKEALATLGIAVGDLVGKNGKLLTTEQIAGVFEKRFRGMGKEAVKAMLSTKALVDVFDVRGLKVISSFIDAGVEGFKEMGDRMEGSRSVSEKFSIAMSGISGSFEKLSSAVQRMAIAFMEGAGPALHLFTSAAVPVMDFLSFMYSEIPIISQVLVGLAGTLVVVGGALLGAGVLMAFVNFGLKNIINFGSTSRLVMRSLSSAVGGLSKALLGLRVAMFAIPGWGWALAGLAAVGGIAAYMMSQGGKKAPARKNVIKRDKDREALGGEVAGFGGNQARARGESIGTFAGIVAGQLGIGPALTAQEQTAANTEKMADGIENLVQQGEMRVPAAAALQAGMNAPGVGGGRAAAGGRDLLSVSERAAIAAEQQNVYLRQLVEQSRGPGFAFV
jgi:TP901 family phage tail tape measure protein